MCNFYTDAVNTSTSVLTYFGLHVLRELQDGVHSGPCVRVILQVSQDFLCQPLLGYAESERKREDKINDPYSHVNKLLFTRRCDRVFISKPVFFKRRQVKWCRENAESTVKSVNNLFKNILRLISACSTRLSPFYFYFTRIPFFIIVNRTDNCWIIR